MSESGLVVSQVLGVTVASLRKSSILDAAAVESIGRELYALIDAQARRKVVLDLRMVQFLSSTMLGVLVNAHKKAQAIKGRFIICGLREKLFEVFKITRLDKILEFADSEEEAIGRFDARSGH